MDLLLEKTNLEKEENLLICEKEVKENVKKFVGEFKEKANFETKLLEANENLIDNVLTLFK